MMKIFSDIVKNFALSRSVPSIEPSPIFEVYLGLGSNLGDRKRNIEKAIDLLGKTSNIKTSSISKFYETAPIGLKDQPNFLNAAIKVETTLKPLKLLAVCQSIERRLKRVRTIRWGPRTIDIDILLYGDLIIKSDKLTIPHPEMHKREFVLKPLNDIAPSVIHSLNGKTVAELYEQFKIGRIT